MEIAYSWAQEIAQTESLPQSLENVKIRADLINKINNRLNIDINRDLESGSKTGQLNNIDKSSKMELLEDITKLIHFYVLANNDKNKLVSIALRLWAGCLSAAKTIAHGTRDGENTAAIRNSIFNFIDERCKIDSVYRAGVEAAPIWKRQIRDTISFDGVPEDSSVRRYSEER
jgi:hypothetical protein